MRKNVSVGLDDQNIILVKVKGKPSEDGIKFIQDQILALISSMADIKVLYDATEMEAPDVDIPLSQWKIDKEHSQYKFKRAIVVSDSKIAYLTRLAFGDGEHKVFYDDYHAAKAWLKS